MKKERPPMVPQIYTCSMTRKEAEAREKAAERFRNVIFKIIGEEGGLVIGQTTVLDFGSFKKFNQYPGVLPTPNSE
jgi:hypothetical protein